MAGGDLPKLYGEELRRATEASLRQEWVKERIDRSDRSLTTERLSPEKSSSFMEDDAFADVLLASLAGFGLGAAAASEELAPSALVLDLAAAGLLTAPQK